MELAHSRMTGNKLKWLSFLCYTAHHR